MNEFKYQLKIGEYEDDVEIDIEIKIKDQLLTSEDYEALRNCLNQLEGIADLISSQRKSYEH